MSRHRSVLRAVLVVVLVAGLVAGTGGQVAADGSDTPTVQDARERWDTASRLAGIAGRTLVLAGGGIAFGLGVGLCVGGFAAFGYWRRRFGS